MVQPKFKKQLVTNPKKESKDISTNVVTPASDIVNKIGPAKFKKLIKRGSAPAPPGKLSASKFLSNKKDVKALFSESKYKSLIHEGTKQYLNNQNAVQLLSEINLVPDIIMVLDFKPAYTETPGSPPQSNPVNDLLNIQINLRDLSEDIINSIMSKLYENEGIRDIVEEKRKIFTQNINDARSKLMLLQGLFERINNYSTAINFKDYTTTAKNANTYSVPSQISVREVFKSDFGFSDISIDNFLNTKVLAQFIEELYSTVTFYSYNFIVARGFNRKLDMSHFSVLKQAKIDIERALKNPILSPYASLSSTLPKQKSDAIKLLSVFLGRELTASRAIGDSNFIKKIEASGIDYTRGDNLFLKIIGRPDNDILTPTGDASSIVDGITLIDNESGGLVLPFETKFVTTQDSLKALFKPGNTYTLDRMVIPAGASGNRTEKLNDVINQTQFGNHAELLRRCLLDELPEGYAQKTTNFLPTDIFDRVLDYFHVVEQKSGDSPTIDEVIFALLNEATKNKKLKILLESFFRPRLDNDNIDYALNGFVGDIAVTGNLDDMWKSNNERKKILEQILDILFPKLYFVFPATGNGLNKKSLTELFLNDSANIGIKSSIINTLHRGLADLVNDIKDSDIYLNTGESLTGLRSLSHSQIWTIVYELFFGMATTLFKKVQFSRDTSGLLVDRGFKGNEPLIWKYGMSLWLAKIKGNATFTPTLGRLGPEALKLYGIRQDIKNEKTQVAKLIQLLDFFEKYESYVSDITKFIKDTDDLFFLNQIQNFVVDATDSKTVNESNFEHFNQQQLAISNKRYFDLSGLINGTAIPKPPPEPEAVQTKKSKTLTQQLQVVSGFSSKFKNIKAKSLSSFVDISAADNAPPPPVYKNDIGSQEYINLFRLWLGTDTALRKDSKILSVGIPLGMTSNLKQKLELLSNNDKNTTISANSEEIDIVKVVMYKEDLEYEDIIFKPKEYIFELSRFVNRQTFNPFAPIAKYIDKSGFSEFISKNKSSETKTLEDIVKAAVTFDFSQGQPSIFNSVIPENGTEFSGQIKLQLGSRLKELKKNHVNSDMLMLYTKLLTGADLQEANFPAINNLIYPAADADLSELFSVLGSEEELQTWAQLFGTKTILTSGDRETIELLVPKKYERIFNIAVCSEDFPIDTKATDSKLLNKLWGEGIIIQDNNEFYLNRNKLQNISLERFYTKISTLSDSNNFPEE